ncbi:MAG: hypothetical protein AAF378_18720 [Cyanobacteria bacterium P01_A01_bin.84]
MTNKNKPFCIEMPKHFPAPNYPDAGETLKNQVIPKDILLILKKLVDGREGVTIYSAHNFWLRLVTALRVPVTDLFLYEINQTEQEKLKAWFDNSGYKFELSKRKLTTIIYDFVNVQNINLSV